MSDESKPAGGALSGNSWIAVLLLAVGAFALREVPLQSSRTEANDSKIEQHYGLQNVSARLWQDPFNAVANERAKSASGPADELHTQEALAGAVKAAVINACGLCTPADPARLVIMPVMVQGGPYAEYEERRRRTRYAVLSALNTVQYSPAQTEYIGYYQPKVAPPRALSPHLQAIPFEWFEVPSDRLAGGHPKRQLLILWLDSDAFGEHPFETLQSLMSGLTPAPKPDEAFSPQAIAWRVIGPADSVGLHAMAKEVEGTKESAGSSGLKEQDLRIYSPTATVSDDDLLADVDLGGDVGPTERESLKAFFHRRGISVLRTIGDDRLLTQKLMTELELRGLNIKPEDPALRTAKLEDREKGYDIMCRGSSQSADSPDHIAIVAEWDTLYGRRLQQGFQVNSDAHRGFCVERASYVRGLDGLLPGDAGTHAASAQPAAKGSAAEKSDSRRADGSYIERAEGQSQFDYLRRLASQLRQRDHELRTGHGENAGIRAIGVLGNDVHDKLLVMQALSPDFPNAIFFTTDLDARYLFPSEQRWARNLVVGSSFGLRLTDGVQGSTPPFRDNYQTASFLAVRLIFSELVGGNTFAQQEVTQRWLSAPRIFEIGRNTAFDFSPARVDESKDGADPCQVVDLSACNGFHPSGSERYPYVSPGMLFLTTNAALFLIWVPLLRLKYFGASPTARPWKLQLWKLIALVLAIGAVHIAAGSLVMTHWSAFADWLTHDGKPLNFTEGISPWPTEMIYLFTLFLGCYLALRGWFHLSHDLDKITDDLHIGETRKSLLAELKRDEAAHGWGRRFMQVWCLRPLAESGATASTSATSATSAPKPAPASIASPPDRIGRARLVLWRFLLAQNRPVSRLIRVLSFTALLFVFALLLHSSLAEPSGMPQRGALSFGVHKCLAFLAFLTLNFLIFAEADATLLCVRCIDALRPKRANWPQASIDHFSGQLGIKCDELIDCWITLQFVAKRTACVANLIYYPFIILSLLLLSRSRIFDDWHMPITGVVMIAIDVLVTLACAAALRLSAERARKTVLAVIEDWRIRESGASPQNSPTEKQLELLGAKVRGMDEGALAPFSRQPVLRAIALPFASFGGSALLEFMTMANL